MCENKCDCSAQGEIQESNKQTIRVTGLIVLIFSICEFGVGGYIFGFLENVQLGVLYDVSRAWWVGLLACISGILALASINRGCLIASCVLSSIGIIIAMVGAIVDGIASLLFKSYITCAHTNDDGSISYSGMPSGDENAALCISQFPSVPLSNPCYCVDTSWNFTNFCGIYELTNKPHDCSAIYTKYPKALSASSALCATCTVLLLCLSVMTCSLLCASANRVRDDPHARASFEALPMTTTAVVARREDLNARQVEVFSIGQHDEIDVQGQGGGGSFIPQAQAVIWVQRPGEKV